MTLREELVEVLRDLLHKGEFYTALLALLHAVILYLVPQFPQGVLIAFDSLVAIIAASFAGRSQVRRVEAVRALRALTK